MHGTFTNANDNIVLSANFLYGIYYYASQNSIS